MDDLKPGSDETILQKIPRIIISGVRYEIMLTNRRIILTERETGTITESIPYPEITSAVSSVNAIREPVLMLSLATRAGEPRSIELVFVYETGGKNVQNLEQCMEILSGFNVRVHKTGDRNPAGPMSRIRAITPGMLTVESSRQDKRSTTPETMLAGPFHFQGSPPGEEAPRSPVVMGIVTVLILLTVIAAGIFLVGQSPQELPADGPNATAPVPAATSTIKPELTMTIAETPVPVITEPQPSLPPNGIWIRVSSTGNYSGNIKAGGWILDINSSQEQFYQMPVQNTLIEGIIEKSEGTGDIMDVEIINGGTVVWSATTAKPYGAIDIHEYVGAAIISKPEGTPVPTPLPQLIPTPDPSITQKLVPASGIFVRASYPGEFSGSITANGIEQLVSGSGDQFYQVSLTSGQIDGFFEKQDGTARDMVVQIYRDGTRMYAMNTTRPFGVVEFHEKLNG